MIHSADLCGVGRATRRSDMNDAQKREELVNRAHLMLKEIRIKSIGTTLIGVVVVVGVGTYDWWSKSDDPHLTWPILGLLCLVFLYQWLSYSHLKSKVQRETFWVHSEEDRERIQSLMMSLLYHNLDYQSPDYHYVDISALDQQKEELQALLDQ